MALQYLSENDFKGTLSTNTLSGLKGAASVNLIEAEKRAISNLDPLRAKFNIDAELDKDGDNRHDVLVRIMVAITAYYLYNTVPDDEIPERIKDNYKEELKTIEKIASGRIHSTLTVLDDDDGEKTTVFRYGSNDTRTHSLR